MKFIPFAIVSIAAFAVAACTPNHPPTEYGDESATGGPRTPPPEAISGGGATGGLQQRDVNAGAARLFDETTGQWNPAAVLTTVYFGYDKYNVEVSEREKLTNVLDKAKHTKIIVAGYTDYFGTDQYNHGLSDKRANSVKTYLVSLGVPDANIEIQAFGKRYARNGGTRTEVADDRRAVIVNADYKP